MRTRQVVISAALAIVGCSSNSEHDHGDEDVHDDHQVPRDPATQPCDERNWRQLLPDLRQCNLANVTLDYESLRRADLSEANLAGANVVGADLFKALLRTAQVEGANLDGAKLTGVDLGGADLTGVSLRGANLTNANLAGALLGGAITDETTICMTGLSGPCW